MTKINLNLEELDPELIEFLFAEQLKGLPIKEVIPWREYILNKKKKNLLS